MNDSIYSPKNNIEKDEKLIYQDMEYNDEDMFKKLL